MDFDLCNISANVRCRVTKKDFIMQRVQVGFISYIYFDLFSLR
jgi:hypothetical protein